MKSLTTKPKLSITSINLGLNVLLKIGWGKGETKQNKRVPWPSRSVSTFHSGFSNKKKKLSELENALFYMWRNSGIDLSLS